MGKNKTYRIRTYLEYGDHYKGIGNSGEIITVPDESYTIQDILEKFTRGIALNISKEGIYTDTDDFDDVDERTYLNDLTDFEEIEDSMAARRSRRLAKTKKTDSPAPEVKPEKPSE